MAIFHLPRDPHRPTDLDDFLRLAGAGGFVTQPYWNQPCTRVFEYARAQAHLLGRLPVDDRPDGLIVRDDNIEEPVLAGLLAAGLRIPQDIVVVAHANFPCSFPRLAPVTRVGYDCRLLVCRGLEVLAAMRRGEAAPVQTWIPAQFEHDLAVEPVASSIALSTRHREVVKARRRA